MSTVVIVGRKNVGKSTIFNRLTGMRTSVVYKEPGVTRDRVFGEVEWRGQTFDIIDTGGFAPDEDTVLAVKIMRQIEYALQDANLIYFVVDGKCGLLPEDSEISRRLRKLNKPVLLLVNKIDNKKEEPKAWEFSGFGFPDLFPVSAEAGIGFGDVLDKTLAILPEAKKIESPHEVPRILILGRPNSGKSTLLNTIINEERAIVDERPGTTRDLVRARFQFNNQTMEIIDTAGLRRRSRVKEPVEFYAMMRALRVIEQADVVVLIFDTTEGVVDQDRRIASMALAKAKGLVIVPNKLDLVDRKDHHRILESTRFSFNFFEAAPVVPISAKARTNIDLLLNKIHDVFTQGDRVIKASLLNEIAKNLKPPSGGAILKMTQVGKRPPIFRVTLTTSVNENYIKYLRNAIRNYFGFDGVPILIRTRVAGRRPCS
jgi:GTP-binding protein